MRDARGAGRPHRGRPAHREVAVPRARKTCSVPGCPEIVDRGRCQGHRREAEQRRGNRHARGYGREHERRFREGDRKSTRLNSSHVKISYAVFCLKKKTRESRETK